MRLLVIVLGLAGAGVLTAVALGSPVALPPVTTSLPSVSVTVPKVSVPLPTTTVKLPPPPPPATTVKLPPAPKPAPTTTSVTKVTTTVTNAVSGATSTTSNVSHAGTKSSGGGGSGGGGAQGGGTQGGTGSSSGSSASAGGSSASSGGQSGVSKSAQGSSRSNVRSFSTTRTWIGTTGPKRRRATTLAFVLQNPSRVIFIVNQVSPACVGIGRFSAAGHAGLNRIRFGGVVHGHRLGPGTYRIAIRTAAGRVVRRITLVVVNGQAPSGDVLQALRASNTCHGGGSASTTSANAVVGAETAAPLGSQQLPKPKPAAAGLALPPGPNLHSGVLGSSVEETARALQPLLVALLALSIVLLGLASLPREAVPGPRVQETLARHRLELVTLGGAALVAVALAFLFT